MSYHAPSRMLSFSTEKVTIAERRLCRLIVLHTQKKDSRDAIIPFSALEGKFYCHHLDIDVLREALTHICSISIKFTLNPQRNIEDEIWQCTTLLSQAVIYPEEKEIHIRVSDSYWKATNIASLREKIFLQATLSTKYSQKLYELFCDNLTEGQDSFSVPIEKLRKFFNIQGDKLKNFADFYRFALEPGLKEINDQSNFNVEVITERSGRGGKVAALRFESHNHNEFKIQNKVKAREKLQPKDKHEAKVLDEILHARYSVCLAYFNQARRIDKRIPLSDFTHIERWYSLIIDKIKV